MPVSKLSQSRDFTGENFYIGLDVHKKSWSVTVRTSNLEVGHFSQTPDPKALYSYLNKKFPSGSYYSAYEAGFSGTSAHTALCKLGIQNIIVHAGDIPNTDKEKKNKTDVHDSRSIAKYLEKGLLKPIHVLTESQQELRSFYRLREMQIADQTRALNRLKGYLNFVGINMPSDMPDNRRITNKQLEWLEKQAMNTPTGKACLQQYIQDYRDQRSRVTEVTKALRNFIIESYSEAYENLMSVPGIGSIIAIALIAEIGDFNRFETPGEYCSYLGMIPWDHSSGDSTKTFGVQPRCNKHLRPLLVEAAWMAIRKDPGLLFYYKKHASKNNKHAIMKVARKIALIAKGVVTNNKRFDPDYLEPKPKMQHRKNAKL